MMSEWQIQLILEFTKIGIFCAQLLLLFIVAGRLRDVEQQLKSFETVMWQLLTRLGKDDHDRP